MPDDTPPKKGMSTLTKVLLVLGVVFVLMLGTCGLGAVWLGKKAKEVTQNLSEGGLVLAAPPEVREALAGPKKDYVGAWRSGPSSIDIDADGNVKYVKASGASKESITAPIAEFKGDSIVMRVGLVIEITVTEPPRRVGDHWEMKAQGKSWERR
jgi:hypothetical protein